MKKFILISALFTFGAWASCPEVIEKNSVQAQMFSRLFKQECRYLKKNPCAHPSSDSSSECVFANKLWAKFKEMRSPGQCAAFALGGDICGRSWKLFYSCACKDAAEWENPSFTYACEKKNSTLNCTLEKSTRS